MGAIPLGYSTKVQLTDAKGRQWESDAFQASQECKSIKVTKRGDLLKVETCSSLQCTKISNLGRLLRWLRGLF